MTKQLPCLSYTFVLLVSVALILPWSNDAFSIGVSRSRPGSVWKIPMAAGNGMNDNNKETKKDDCKNKKKHGTATKSTRRSILQSTLLFPLLLHHPSPSSAAVGTLPEFSSTNAILQGLTVNVADLSQLDAMRSFLESGFQMKVLRQAVVSSVTEVWMGYGPEQIAVPDGFEVPVSSFGMNGGHSSVRMRYDSKGVDVFYRKGEDAPGDNVAYLQLGVPEYRISQMISNGGTIIDAYGFVNVVSPVGLPVRGIVGIAPDPIMFLAINCLDVAESRAFYERLGFQEQKYPYCRPQQGDGQFEPSQPEGSVYLSPSPNCMGVLLLSSTGKKKPKKLKNRRPLRPNPVLQSLDIVYTPSDTGGEDDGGVMGGVIDPSQVGLSFTSAGVFAREERKMRTEGQRKRGLSKE